MEGAVAEMKITLHIDPNTHQPICDRCHHHILEDTLKIHPDYLFCRCKAWKLPDCLLLIAKAKLMGSQEVLSSWI